MLGIILRKCGGPYYQTRDGRRAAVTEHNGVPLGDGHFEPIWQGSVEGRFVEWDNEGRERSGDSALDLVGTWRDKVDAFLGSRGSERPNWRIWIRHVLIRLYEEEEEFEGKRRLSHESRCGLRTSSRLVR